MSDKSEFDAALATFEARRTANKNIKHVDNGSLRAGAPMYFYCPCCGGEIVLPEIYRYHPTYCTHCKPLVEKAWLTKLDDAWRFVKITPVDS